MSVHTHSHCQVWLERCPDYTGQSLEDSIFTLLDLLLIHKLGDSTHGTRPDVPEPILLKPNFISRKNSGLCCTHPLVIRAVASYFHNLGKQVIIADSPAFGLATRIAKDLDLPQLCKGLGVRFADFKDQSTLKIPGCGTIKIAGEMLSAGLIVNLPKLKVHQQLAMTGAVKNFFGAVPGVKKALAHVRFGEHASHFAQMLLHISAAFPQSIHLADGILAMHQDGPINGQRYTLGVIAASLDPVALDTALATIIGLDHEQVPIWKEARRQNLPGAFVENIDFPCYLPQDFPCPGFRTITALQPISFHPWRLTKSAVLRLMAKW